MVRYVFYGSNQNIKVCRLLGLKFQCFEVPLKFHKDMLGIENPPPPHTITLMTPHVRYLLKFEIWGYLDTQPHLHFKTEYLKHCFSGWILAKSFVKKKWNGLRNTLAKSELVTKDTEFNMAQFKSSKRLDKFPNFIRLSESPKLIIPVIAFPALRNSCTKD